MFISFFLFFTKNAFADSPYVLPYPSFMPGTIFYKVDRVIQFVQKYWYFGDFGQFTYNLKESDRYLVQAETLFQYKQYLLGFEALQQSDAYFQKTQPDLDNAKRDGKDTSDDELLLHQAAQKHIEVLEFIETITPPTFIWTPEKSAASTLNIHSQLQNSISIRQNI